MKCYAVLLDTVSIQKYIFSSGKLKDNIGASYLVKQTLEDYLEDSLKVLFSNYKEYFGCWKKNPEKILMKEDPSAPFEVGYIGGGNALLFFRDNIKANKFIKEWTTRLLVKAPGLTSAVACMEFDLDNFKLSQEILFEILQKNKNSFIPQTVIPRHGITAECSRSGYSMEAWNESPLEEEKGYVSSVIMAKIHGLEEANEKIRDDFKDILQMGEKKYCFPHQLEELGHLKGKDSHIAVVHIDGNGMADVFKKANCLAEYRVLSKVVKKITHDSLKETIKEKIVEDFERIMKALGLKDEKQRKYLPLRPIIIGGDDITFVCNGKLGIYLAKCYLRKFEELSKKNKELNILKNNLGFEPLSASAGIAITKAKFPFYRGYELAEQLCRSAKVKRKEKELKGSWLDFHIAYGGFSGTLEEIRESHYKAIKGNLLYRPYYLAQDDGYNFDAFVAAAKELLKEFPQSKIMELREVLTLPESAADTFVDEAKALNRKLPIIPGGISYDLGLWIGGETPYFDLIELIDFYPDFELRNGGGTQK
jgi:hypothetical protein